MLLSAPNHVLTLDHELDDLISDFNSNPKSLYLMLDKDIVDAYAQIIRQASAAENRETMVLMTARQVKKS